MPMKALVLAGGLPQIDLINKLIEKSLPCSVHGGVLKQFTRAEDGSCYLLLTNNGGITNTVANGETVSPFSTRKAVVTVKKGFSLTAEQTDGAFVQKDDKTVVTLRAGQYFFAKIN